jgi:hypothetical protein
MSFIKKVMYLEKNYRMSVVKLYENVLQVLALTASAGASAPETVLALAK